MPRRRYDDDDEGFPDIRQKPGTPSDSFGGAYGPPDSDSESGYSRPGTAGSGESGSASLTFENSSSPPIEPRPAFFCQSSKVSEALPLSPEPAVPGRE